MSVPIMWTDCVGWAVVWERQEMGQAPEVWLLAQTMSAGVAAYLDSTIDPEIGTLFRTRGAAERALRDWMLSARSAMYPGHQFRVCRIQAAYVASEVTP